MTLYSKVIEQQDGWQIWLERITKLYFLVNYDKNYNCYISFKKGDRNVIFISDSLEDHFNNSYTCKQLRTAKVWLNKVLKLKVE